MSVYPGMNRHKRYLSFRYIFPELAAAAIVFRRLLLRIRWFCTHPVDEFVDTAVELLFFPIDFASRCWLWLSGLASDLWKDLKEGLTAFWLWFSRIPVFTGGALAGVLGVILTILLFLFPAVRTTPVPAAIGAQESIQPLLPPSAEPEWKTVSPPEEPEFDPFAPPESLATLPVLPFLPEDTSYPPANQNAPTLWTSVTRLAMPLGWDSRRRINVVSSSQPQNSFAARSQFDRLAAQDGWGVRRTHPALAGAPFSPYASRLEGRTHSSTEGWVAPEDLVDPQTSSGPHRRPAVSVEKMGPDAAPVGRPFRYTLLVRNLSGEAIDSLQVHEHLSALERVSDVRPAASVVGDALVWDITDFAAGDVRRMEVEVYPDAAIELTHRTVVQVTNSVAAASEVRHPRPEKMPSELPEPSIELEPAPDVILPGPDPPEEPSLAHSREAEPAPFPWHVEPAGDVRPMPVVEAAPIEEPPAAPERSWNAYTEEHGETQPTASPLAADEISLEMHTPDAVVAGSSVRTIFSLHNHGDDHLKDVVLNVRLSDELEHTHGRSLILRIEELAAGETYRTRLTTRAAQDGKATITSRLNAPGAEEKTAQREVQIAQHASPGPAPAIIPPCCFPSPCGPWAGF